MRERALNLKAWEIRAILEGRKTQFRRLISRQLPTWQLFTAEEDTHGREFFVICGHEQPSGLRPIIGKIVCPYGELGTKLWVREAHAPMIGQDSGLIAIDYRATYEHNMRLGDELGLPKRWTSAVHMRREYSRILLEVMNVRVERLQDIGKDGREAHDVLAEGIDPAKIEQHRQWFHPDDCPSLAFRDSWCPTQGSGSWDENPWVWVASFRRVEQEARAA